jgi:hypothetical protein
LTQGITTVEGDPARPSYVLSRVALVLGIVLFTASNIFYVVNTSEFYDPGGSPLYSFTTLAIITIASVSLGVAGFSFLRTQAQISPVADGYGILRWQFGRIISDAVFQQKRLFVSITTIYGIFFAFLDGIVVYQPQVDFSISYAVSGPSIRFLTCCGSPAYVPVGLLYLPAQHLGVELFPLSVLLMLLVSLLVGLNAGLLVRAFRLSRTQDIDSSKRKGAAGGILGAAFGLFAGCPTCAATFFISMIAGTGATALSTLISSYQPLIVAVTVPLLFFSIYWQAKSIGIILQGCNSKVETK